MNLLAALVVFALLVVLCTLAGRAVALALGQNIVTIEFALLFGLLLLHTWMVIASQLGLPWNRWTLFAPLILGGVVAGLVCARQGRSFLPAARSERPSAKASGWRLVADLLLAAVVLLFAWSAVGLKLVHSDFIYHWGVKGQRFFVTSGIDWAYLARPETGIYHPDYPLLLPNLYASLAVARGVFEDHAQQLWACLFLAVLVVSGVRFLESLDPRSWASRVAALAVAAVTAAFGLAYFQAGGPDLPFAALFLVATVEILTLAGISEARSIGHQTSSQAALRVGVLAALLASCKLEGLFAAAVLIGLVGVILCLGWWRSERRSALKPRAVATTALALILPLLVSTGPWLSGVRRYDLFQSASNSGEIRLENAASIVRAMVEVLWMPQWQGLCLVILVTPLLMLSRKLRWAALFILLQLSFYGYAYLTSPHEPVFFVKSNFPRLLYHLVPSVCLVALGWLVSRAHQPLRRIVHEQDARV